MAEEKSYLGYGVYVSTVIENNEFLLETHRGETLHQIYLSNDEIYALVQYARERGLKF